MKFFLISTLLSLFVFNSLAEKKDGTNKSFFGQDQEQFKTIFSTINPKSFPREESQETYSPRYRPPSTNSESVPGPTLVHVGIKLNIVVPRFGFVSIAGTLETLHNDSRLAYEVPKGFSKKYISPQEDTSYYNRLSIWQPNLALGMRRERYYADPFDRYPQRDPYAESDNGRNGMTLFNSEGLVYCKSSVSKNSKGKLGSDNATLTTSLKLFDDRYFKEDLVLEWNPEEAFTFQKNADIFNHYTLPGNKSYNVVHTLDKCNVSVNHGPFGVRERSCLELKLSLVPIVE